MGGSQTTQVHQKTWMAWSRCQEARLKPRVISLYAIYQTFVVGFCHLTLPLPPPFNSFFVTPPPLHNSFSHLFLVVYLFLWPLNDHQYFSTFWYPLVNRLSFCLSVHLCLYVRWSIQSIGQGVSSVCLSVHLSVCMSVGLSVHLSASQFCLSVHLSVCPLVCQSIYQSGSQSVCQSVCLSITNSFTRTFNLTIIPTPSLQGQDIWPPSMGRVRRGENDLQ